MQKDCFSCKHERLDGMLEPCASCLGAGLWEPKDLPNDMSQPVSETVSGTGRLLETPSETSKSSAESTLNSQVGGSHYQGFKIQPAEFLAMNSASIPFAEGCIIKYATRHRAKNGVEDLKKIIHYARIIAEFEYNVKI